MSKFHEKPITDRAIDFRHAVDNPPFPFNNKIYRLFPKRSSGQCGWIYAAQTYRNIFVIKFLNWSPKPQFPNKLEIVGGPPAQHL
jgi:hypothetical protein